MVLSVAAVRATSVTGSCCQGHLAAELDGEDNDEKGGLDWDNL